MWNSIFLPSTTSPPKDLRPKPSPLSRAIFGRCPRPSHLFSQVGVSDPRRKKVLPLFYMGAFVGAAGDWAAPTNQTPFVGAARNTSHPCCSVCRGSWCLGTLACHCRGGSITSRPYKKFEPLLKIIFYVVTQTHMLQWDAKISSLAWC